MTISTFVGPHLLPDISFNGDCSMKNNIFILKKYIYIYISYTLTPSLRNLKTNITLNNCLFGSLKLS